MVSMDVAASAEALQAQVSGQVLTPDHPHYNEFRLSWNRSNDQYPALILAAENVEDVVAGVRFAEAADLNIAVQSTGHGHQFPADDALLIITSNMKGVHVDPEARTARVEAGVLWGEVLAHTTPHGLAPLLGSSPYVGVVGYTLGGGIGWLARKFGLAADSVRRIELVTADGFWRRASATENPELFWGLRGGGGNFGVVTALEFDLYPVASLYGGQLTYQNPDVAEMLRFYREWVKTLPHELTSSITVFKFPSLPFVPEAMRGQIQVLMKAAYIGDPAEAQKLIQPWLEWRTPAANTFHELPFAEVGTISNDPVDPTAGYGSHEMFDELSDGAIAVITKQMTNQESPLAFTELRHAGGAITHVAPDANAIGNRDAVFFMQTAGLVPTPELYAAVKAAIRDYKAKLRPHVRGGVCLNFMKGEESGQRVRDAYLPESYQRLLALKARYDADNRFRFSYQLVQE